MYELERPLCHSIFVAPTTQHLSDLHCVCKVGPQALPGAPHLLGDTFCLVLELQAHECVDPQLEYGREQHLILSIVRRRRVGTHQQIAGHDLQGRRHKARLQRLS